METYFFKTVGHGLLLGLWWALTMDTAGAVSATVTPDVVTNDYVGKITLTITGLVSGQTVALEKIGDLNANGAIDGGEPAFQAGFVTDGNQPRIGGVRNLNVPGDEDGTANGQIRLELNYPGNNGSLDAIAQKYLIKISDSAGLFPPVIKSFEVKQKIFPQGVKGRISALGTGLPLANAHVVLLPSDGGPVTGTVTDANGNYTLYALPGGYRVLPFISGYVGDFNGAVTVTGAALAVLDLALPAANRTISGKLQDSDFAIGIPGIFIQATSASGQFVTAFTQGDGSYSVGVLAGSWDLEPSSESLLQVGYLGWQNGTNVSTANGPVTNFNLPVDSATALIYGTVKNRQNNPVVGVELEVRDTSNRYDAYGARSFPPNADYCVGVRAGNWSVGANSRALSALGYTGRDTNVTVTVSQALRVDFTLEPVNAHLVGRVVDNLGAPVGNIGIHAYDQQGGGSNGNTDTSGVFDLGVSGGTWNLVLSLEDAEQRQLISPQLSVQLADGETHSGIIFVVRHATAKIHGQVKNASAVPLANVAVYGSLNVQGTNYFVRVRTDANGDYQLPAFNGLWQVSLECYDLQKQGYVCAGSTATTVAGADVTLNFVVQSVPSLQITTTSLPKATVGSFYSAQLQASGGQQPYGWSLSPGSNPLPSGLFLGNDGTLGGTPGVAGTFSFSVRVTGANSPTVADQLLSLSINPASSPLQVTTSSLFDGAFSAFYSQSVYAIGGQAPYSWSLAPGSAPLPPGLNLTSGGVISGTPTGSGTFFFNVRVTDAQSATADGLLSIYIPTLPLQMTTLSLAAAQQGDSYSAQLQAAGGQTPYRWSLAPGSLGLPPGLDLSSSGVISGTPIGSGTFFFIVRVTDANADFISRSLSLTVNPMPTLTALNLNGGQFQLWLSGVIGQTYTVQYSTNPASPNWLSLTVTNLSAASVTIRDANATNATRYYRARVGP